jgi:hypothetical protein
VPFDADPARAVALRRGDDEPPVARTEVVDGVVRADLRELQHLVEYEPGRGHERAAVGRGRRLVRLLGGGRERQRAEREKRAPPAESLHSGAQPTLVYPPSTIMTVPVR